MIDATIMLRMELSFRHAGHRQRRVSEPKRGLELQHTDR
jgi:hypothetical protein